MASQNRKNNIIEELSDAFESIQDKRSSANYNSFIARVQLEVLDILETKKTLTRKDIQKIVNKQRITNKGIRFNTMLSTVLSELSFLVDNDKTKLSQKEKRRLRPLRKFATVFSLNNPKRTATAIANITRVYLGGDKEKLSSTERKVFDDVSTFFNNNRKEISENIKRVAEQTKDMNNIIKNKTSKQIFEKFQQLSKTEKTFEGRERKIREAFSAENDQTRVQRILRTETHARNQEVKLAMAQLKGLTHKQWIPKDGNYRDTDFHNDIVFDIVPINEKYKAAGFEADFPGDTSLPAGERINCRCQSRYVKGPSETSTANRFGRREKRKGR